ncbi:MAG: hypothetical protein R3C01_07885 [Planctomycetaceae bacterium]
MPTAQQVYSMLGNESLWQLAAECHRALNAANIPYSVCGGVAVCLHGYQRNTADLDLIVRRTDTPTIRAAFEQLGLLWDAEQAEFRSLNGIAVQFLYAGDRAGPGAEVSLPDPEGEFSVEVVEGLPVLKLSKLIEVKIACGTGNVRRTHKDLADVVELIILRNLDSSFARFLHKSVRQTFRELVRNARGLR